MTSHTRHWKEEQLSELKTLFDSYPVIGLADLTNFPASLFQLMRKKFHGKALIRVSKRNVIKKALAQSNLESKALDKYLNGSCGIIFTEMNPFELFALLKKSKGNAFAKGGMIAPDDIVVPAGDTGLPPGPALSDLKQAGLDVKLGGATIVITKDKVVTKKGEIVNAAVAGTLAKLNIKPIKIGLNLIAAYEKGEVFKSEVLNIDVDQVFNDFRTAYSNALNLAVEIAYFTPETIPVLLRKAALQSFNLAVEAEIYSKETIELFLGKANAQANALKALVKDVVPEEKREETKEESTLEPKEEKPAEEKPVEEKKEPVKEETVEEKKEEAKEKKAVGRKEAKQKKAPEEAKKKKSEEEK